MSIVYLHVGLPKTGTTHLQNRLWLNREQARTRAGLLYPGVSEEDHFYAAVRLQPERYAVWLTPERAEAWPRMLDRMRAWPGTSLISHELFANAQPQHVAELLRDLSFADEVHVILTVRDLARQLPSAWQENTKNQRPLTFEQFLETVVAHAPGAEPNPEIGSEPFWEFQDTAAVIGTWAAVLPPERIHVVTVPAGRATPGDTLWDRFLSVLGVDPAVLPRTDDRSNASLTAAQGEFLARLNSRLQPADDFEPWRYDVIVKRHFSTEGLGGTTTGTPPRLGPANRAWAAQQSERLIAAIVESGCSVTGTLDDLRVNADSTAEVGGPPTAEEVLEAGLDALAQWIKVMPSPETSPADTIKRWARTAADRAKDRLPARFQRG